MVAYLIVNEKMCVYVLRSKVLAGFFITDAALCSGERKTLSDATKECREYLSSQISITNPKLVIAFGNEALHSLRQLIGDPRNCVPEEPKSFDDVTVCHG